MSLLFKNKVLAYSLIGVLSLLGLTFLAASFSYVFLAAMVFVIFWTVFNVVKDEEVLAVFNYNPKQSSIFFGLSFLTSLWIVTSSVYFDKTIYVWDQANYWLITNDFNRDFFPDIIAGLDRLYVTIQLDDYNVFPTIPLLPWNKLVGNSFFQWSMSVYLFSLLPAILLFILLFTSILKEEIQKNNWYLLFCIVWVFFFPQFFGAATRGYLDGFGLLFISAVLYDIYNDKLEKLNVKKSILVGVLFVFLLFTRRWYAFWVVSYFVAVFASRVILFLLKELTIDKLKTGVFQLFISGLTAVSILFIGFKDFLDRSIGGQYKDVLSAWKIHSDAQMLLETFRFFGPVFVVLSVLGLFYGIKNKKNKGFALALLFITVSSYFLFTRVQSLGLHHNYLLTPFFLVFSFLGIAFILSLLKGKSDKPVTNQIIVISSLLLIGFLTIFTKTGNEKFNFVSKQFCGTQFYSIQRADIDRLSEIRNLLNDLNPKGKDTKGVYVLASSYLYNYQTFKNSSLPTVKCAINGLYDTKEVDRRDGFPVNFFRSDYVIVAEPLQTHLNPDEQTTVKFLAEQLLSGQGIGGSYEMFDHYEMSDGVVVKLFKKTKSLQSNDIQAFVSVLQTRYPDMSNVFQLNPKDLVEERFTKGNYSSANFTDNNTIYFHPGGNDASSLVISTLGYYSKIKFTVSSADAEGVQKNCNKDVDGEINLKISAGDSVLYDQYCTWREAKNVELPISGFNKIKIQVDKGHFGTGCDGYVLKNFQLIHD